MLGQTFQEDTMGVDSFGFQTPKFTCMN